MSRRALFVFSALAVALVIATGVLAGVLLTKDDDEQPSSARADETGTSVAAVPTTQPKGWLGLNVASFMNGPRITAIDPNGPSARLDLQVNDVIRAVDGLVVRQPAALSAAIEAKAPGTRVRLTVERVDNEFSTDVTLGTAPVNARIEATPPTSTTPATSFGSPSSAQTVPLPQTFGTTPEGVMPFVMPVLTNQIRSGLNLQPITPDLKQKYSLQKQSGLVVVNVVPQSFGARAGFQEGDVVLSIGGISVSDDTSVISPVALDRTFDNIQPGIPVNFRILRANNESTLPLTLPRRAELPVLGGAPPALRLMIENLVDSGALSLDQAKNMLGSSQTPGTRVGRVKDISISKLTLYFGALNDDMSIAVTPDTRFQRGAFPISGSELQSGEVVMVLSVDGGKTAVAVYSYGA